MLTIYAPAKINLVLEVLGKDNNYHEISSIIQSIDLCDVLNFQLDEEICFKCNEPCLNNDNLVLRAANLLKENTHCNQGAYIELHKHIPLAVGLGGGSSDAAATLIALNTLWKLRLPLSELADLASKLGSDVPFFVHKGTALVEGKGERVTSLPSLPLTYFILLVPPVPKIPNKTKEMYNNLNTTNLTKGKFVKQALSNLKQDKAIPYELMFNVFKKIAFNFFVGLDKYGKTMEEAGAPGVYLAGSGPCLFTLSSDYGKAHEIFQQLKKQGLQCYLASSFTNTNAVADC